MLIYEDGNPLCRIVDGSPSAGARSGMPLATALERCPGATAIAANMKLYQRQWAAVIGRLKSIAVGVEETNLEVWPESHWPGFALRQADVLQSYTA